MLSLVGPIKCKRAWQLLHCALICDSEKLDKLCTSCPKLNLKILRIYGRAVEAREYPGTDNRGKAKSDYSCPDWARSYALHHKIRAIPSGSKLIEFEQKLECLPVGSIPNGKTCRDYRKTLIEAEDAVLSEHFDIVLCTCNETSSKRILRCVFPRQCIVDECGMANEPECITSLELCDHIVLVGDHKQLQPVINYGSAREHGLSTSLFQRYAEKFEDLDIIKKLTIQYRMVISLQLLTVLLQVATILVSFILAWSYLWVSIKALLQWWIRNSWFCKEAK